MSANNSSPPPGCPLHKDSSSDSKSSTFWSSMLSSNQSQPTESCTSDSLSTPTITSASISACPVNHSSQPVLAESQTTDARIVGDIFPDSKPHPEQKLELNTTPIPSIIPKAGTDDGTWVFPSPQRFFNAMKKKGYDPAEQEMVHVVSIHNTINENCWKKVLEYESFHAHKCTNPKLAKFRGLPNDLSPKAKIMSMIGYSAPFDRHDWTIDRCGKEVRYVLDFYQGADIMDPTKPVSVYVDVRPAVSVSGVFDRLRMQLAKWRGEKPSIDAFLSKKSFSSPFHAPHHHHPHATATTHDHSLAPFTAPETTIQAAEKFSDFPPTNIHPSSSSSSSSQ